VSIVHENLEAAGVTRHTFETPRHLRGIFKMRDGFTQVQTDRVSRSESTEGVVNVKVTNKWQTHKE
jgi:hypothetical protein